MLRRLKSDVAKDLPPKKELTVYCKLTKEQIVTYKAVLKNNVEVSPAQQLHPPAATVLEAIRCSCGSLVAHLSLAPLRSAASCVFIADRRAETLLVCLCPGAERHER